MTKKKTGLEKNEFLKNIYLFLIDWWLAYNMGFPDGSLGKESSYSVGDLGSIPGLGREGKDYPLQYSGLENSMDWIVHRVAKSRTQLSGFHFPFTILVWFLPYNSMK